MNTHTQIPTQRSNKTFVEVCATDDISLVRNHIQTQPPSAIDYHIALNYCCRNNRENMYQMLYKLFKYDTRFEDNYDISDDLLLNICQYDRYVLLKKVIEFGILKCISDDNLNECGKECAKRGYYKCFMILKDNTKINLSGLFELAAKNNHTEIAKNLLEYFNKNDYNENILNDIYIECTKNDRSAMFELLVEYFGSHTINFDYKYGMVLAWPCNRQHVNIVRYLLYEFNDFISKDTKENVQKVINKVNNNELTDLFDYYF